MRKRRGIFTPKGLFAQLSSNEVVKKKISCEFRKLGRIQKQIGSRFTTEILIIAEVAAP